MNVAWSTSAIPEICKISCGGQNIQGFFEVLFLISSPFVKSADLIFSET